MLGEGNLYYLLYCSFVCVNVACLCVCLFFSFTFLNIKYFFCVLFLVLYFTNDSRQQLSKYIPPPPISSSSQIEKN